MKITPRQIIGAIAVLVAIYWIWEAFGELGLS